MLKTHKHTNVIFTETWIEDNPVPQISNVTCAECGEELPIAKEAIENFISKHRLPLN